MPILPVPSGLYLKKHIRQALLKLLFNTCSSFSLSTSSYKRAIINLFVAILITLSAIPPAYFFHFCALNFYVLHCINNDQPSFQFKTHPFILACNIYKGTITESFPHQLKYILFRVIVSINITI